MLKTLAAANRSERAAFKIPRSVQQTIPIQRIYRDGIWQVNGKFSQTWRFADINYTLASYEDQKEMFTAYCAVLNSLPTDATTKITINNRRLNSADFHKSVLMREQGDGLDLYRREYNAVLMDKAAGSNNLVQDKYITICAARKNVEEARTFFRRVDADLAKNLGQLDSGTRLLDTHERLRILHGFFRPGEEQYYSFDLGNAMRLGHDFRDYICPDGMRFRSDHFEMGGRFGRVLFLRDYPSYIKDTLISELSDFPRNLMLSIDILPIPTAEAVRDMSRPPFCYWTGLNHWILLLHNLVDSWRFPLTVVATILFVAVVAYTTRNGWRHIPLTRKAPRGLVAYYRRILCSKSNTFLLFGLIFLLTGWVWYSGGAPQNGREWVFRLLEGHGTGYFYPLGFMALLLAELFPLWPLGRMLSQAASEHSVCLAVRLKRREDMLWTLLRVSGEWIACWCGLLLLAEVVPALLLGFEFPVGLILETTGLRFLDMATQALVICLLLCLSGQTIIGFLSVVILHILSLLPIPGLPVGLSSLLRLHFVETGGAIQPIWAALELGVCNLILLFWIYRYGAQRLFEKGGG